MKNSEVLDYMYNFCKECSSMYESYTKVMGLEIMSGYMCSKYGLDLLRSIKECEEDGLS